MTQGPTDFTPYLVSGTDTDLMTAGFQGDFSILNVTALGAQTGMTGRVQEGVNLVDSDGVVNVGAGTFEGTILITKTVDLVGSTDMAGDPTTTLTANLPGGGPLLTVQGAGFTGSQDVNLSNLSFVGNGAANVDNGILVQASTRLDTLSVTNSSFTNFDTTGISIFGDNTNMGISAQNVVLTDLQFTNNGIQDIGGAGDINIFEYNGNAAFSDLVLSNSGTGARQGIQFRGVGAGTGVGVLPMGTVSLDDVDISGTYRTTFLGFQRYSNVSTLTLNNVELGAPALN